MKFFIIFLALITIISITILIIEYIIRPIIKKKHSKKNKNNIIEKENGTYTTKNSLLTPIEIQFFQCFQNILKDYFYIFPQINLATIINKISSSKYQNELFRNIDFGIFDKNFKPLLLIEINDLTHKQKDRIERDKKVLEICSMAGLPVIQFWTSYGINPEYIEQKFRQFLYFPNRQ